MAGCRMILAIWFALKLNVGCVSKDGHICAHDDTPGFEVYHADTGRSLRGGRTLSADFQPIRIHVHYVQANSSKLLPGATDFIKYMLMPTVTEEFGRIVRVRRTPGPIRLSRTCLETHPFYVNKMPLCPYGCHNETFCAHALVPLKHLQRCHRFVNGRMEVTAPAGGGVKDADIVIYVTTITTLACKHNAIAEARYCQLERDLDRPIAGNVNLCPGRLVGRLKLEKWKSAVTHEIMHVLGFSNRLFPFFRDRKGEPLTPRSVYTGFPTIVNDRYEIGERVVKKFIRKDWRVRSGLVGRTVWMLVTPAVKAEARRHFNCPTLEGAELEDQGSSGNSLSHLEKRAFEDELMTALPMPNLALSRISLAVLEDSGWYQVNYSRATPLTWGRGLGCDFAAKSCMDWMKAKRSKGEPLRPYCDDRMHRECSLDGSDSLLCNIIRYKDELPKQFQNYKRVPGAEDEESVRYGGSITLADYCAYQQKFHWTTMTSKCADSSNNHEARHNAQLEDYGANSRCFTHGSKWRKFNSTGDEETPNNFGSGCYRYTCGPEMNYTVHIGNVTYHCVNEDEVVDIDVKSEYYRRTGTIVCAGYEDVCMPTTATDGPSNDTWRSGDGWATTPYDCRFAGPLARGRDRCLPMDLETAAPQMAAARAGSSGLTNRLLASPARIIVFYFYIASMLANVLVSAENAI